jgi:hypothetical protein
VFDADPEALENEVHDAPLLIEYWYAVMALPPLLDGARTTRVKPPTRAVSLAIVGAPGVVAADLAEPSTKLSVEL